MYYWGGPAMWNEGSSVTVLARYLSPAAGQTTSDKVKDIWGAAAVVTAEYQQGKAVLFGPHPEWPGAGPVTRMYAQALYYVTTLPKASSLVPSGATTLPETISADRVQAITDTVAEARPVLADSIRMAITLNNLPLGGTYHPLGLWYGGSLLVYSQELKRQMDQLSRDARALQQEYARLNKLKSRVANDPQALQWIATSQAYIEQFFSYAEDLPPESHVIAETDWTGAGPFQPYPVANEAKSFPDLIWAFSYLREEIRDSDLPVASAYAKLLAEYDALRAAYLLDPTPATKQVMDDKYLAISSSWPAGPMYQGMYTLRHTLDIMQYKVDSHLLNLLTRAGRAKEVLSVSKYALADKSRNSAH